MGPKGKLTGGKGKNAPASQPEKKGKTGSTASEGDNNAPETGNKKSNKSHALENRTDPSVPKQSKAAVKHERQERERTRLADHDEMMAGMPNYDSDEDAEDMSAHIDFAGMSKKKTKDLTTDKFGNTVSISKLAEDKRVEEMRAAARARREAKEEERKRTLLLPEDEDQAASASTSKMSGDDVEGLDAKLALGLKLSHKERKALKQQNRVENEMQEMQSADPHLASFSLTLQAQRGVERGPSTEDQDSVNGAEWATASATDVVVPCFSLAAPGKNLLVDASLRIVSGRRYGVMGSNGCGKSTLLHFLAARRLPIPNGVDVLLVQQEVLSSPVPIFQQVLEADVQRSLYVKQLLQLEEQFSRQDALALEEAPSSTEEAWTEKQWQESLERYVAIGEQWEASGADRREARVRRILTGLGFSQAMQEAGSEQLSGGWRMRVSLATALFIEPKLLLLDEPTNHLDLNAVLWLDDYLSNHWSKQSTFLVVSHDADFLDSVCSDMLHLDDGQINAYRGDFSYFESMRGKILAKKEKEYQLQVKTVKEFAKGGMGQEKAEKKALQKLNSSVLKEKPREYKVNFVLHSAEDDSPAIDMLDVSFGYSKSRDKCLFQKVRLKVDSHSRVAIVGPNGAGKSTLLRLLRGTLEPQAGEVIRHHHLRIGWYDQHFETLLPFESTPVAFLQDTCGVDRLEARKYLGMFGLDGSRHLIKIGQLSGGQKSRVILASLSLQRPNILILDEPTNHLDMESVEALIRAIKQFAGGVVLVSHDARLISATECDIWVVGDSDSGVRVERQGFSKYRADVMASIAREEALAEQRAERAAARSKAERARRVENMSARCGRGGGGGGGPPSKAKEGMASVFRKDDSSS